MNKARIIYTPNYKGRAGYKIEMQDTDEWKLLDFYELMRREHALADERRLYIRADMINSIFCMLSQGYEITFIERNGYADMTIRGVNTAIKQNEKIEGVKAQPERRTKMPRTKVPHCKECEYLHNINTYKSYGPSPYLYGCYK